MTTHQLAPEKLDYAADHVEEVAYSNKHHSDDSDIGEFTAAEQRRIIRKIDWRLVPICGIMYCISLLDRTNTSAANIAGMSKELKLVTKTVDRYSVIVLVFFITYVLCQPPATIICRKLGPRNFIPTIVVLWGACMVGMGFVKSWSSLMALRLILGIFEAGFFPSVVYLMSTWFIRAEMGKRYSIFYCIGSFASALGGIFAYGFLKWQGLHGLGAWRWLFIVEGAASIGIGFLGYLLLVGFPDDAKHKNTIPFLSHREVEWVKARVQADRGDVVLEPFHFRKWLSGGADAKIWAFATIFGSVTTVTYALAYFLPQILLYGMGFSLGASQCLVAPPYAFGGIWMISMGFISDKVRMRGPFIIINAIMCLIGLLLMGYVKNLPVRYFGVFLATAGANANIPMVMSYQANNIRGQWKRAFCSATLVGFGGIGGIVGSTVFRAVDAPKYKPGLLVTIFANVLIILIVCGLTLKFRRDNKKADRGELVLENSVENDGTFRYTI